MSENSVRLVIDNALCTACGACASICAKSAIKYTNNAAGYLTAVVDESLCVDCGACLTVCPSNHQSKLPFTEDDPFHGKCLAGYIGHSTDDENRQKSQSGGIVTALLCYLLDKHLVDGAIVNQFCAETRRPRAVIAESIEGIMNSCGSYYTQTAVVDEILKHQDKKTAAVVLGCQAEAIQLLRAKGKVLPEYLIGLVCIGQNSGFMVDDLIKQAGCAPSGERERVCVCRLRFKDKDYGGWPGNVHIESDKATYTLPAARRHALKPVYELYRCILCFDQMNAFSDIVCGDPWGIKGKQSPLGYTVVIAHTEKGKQLLEDAQSAGYISLEGLSVNAIMKGQTVDGRQKTKFFTAKSICSQNGWRHPYHPDAFPSTEIPFDKKLEKRLNYTRALYLAKTTPEAYKLINKRKRAVKISLLRPQRILRLLKKRALRLLRR